MCVWAQTRALSAAIEAPYLLLAVSAMGSSGGSFWGHIDIWRSEEMSLVQVSEVHARPVIASQLRRASASNAM